MKRLGKKLLAGAVVLGLAATAFGSGASASTLRTQYLETNTNWTWHDKPVTTSASGTYKLTVSPFKAAKLKKGDSYANLVIRIFEKDPYSRYQIRTCTFSPSSKSQSCTVNLKNWVDGSDKKAEIQIGHKTNFYGSPASIKVVESN